ncbi:MAG: rhodanese-like domain-containing protein, partial [Thermodesulfobacteriota bacterium]
MKKRFIPFISLLITLLLSVDPLYAQAPVSLPELFLDTEADQPYDYPNPQFLVSMEWALEHIDDPDLRIIDMENSVKSYLEGHIPGAVYIDIEDIRRERKGVKGILPYRKKMERILSGLGVGNDTMVVIYD